MIAILTSFFDAMRARPIGVVVARCDEVHGSRRTARLARGRPARSTPARWVAFFMTVVLSALAACGGDGNGSMSPAPVPVAITAQPVSVSVVAGTAATFSVGATGDGLSDQWQRSTDGGANWSNIAGATSATYTVAATDATLNGFQYRVVVTGTVGSVTSSAATLAVTPAPTPPSIAAQPSDQVVTAGTSASFSVTASGTSLAYQWQSSVDGVAWTAISGATGATLVLNGLTVADNGKRFRVVVGNSVGSVTSSSALLTVNPVPVVPVIVTQPLPASVTAPAVATFSVVATGTPTPGYQWQVSTDGGATYADIAGATGASYTTAATTVADSGKSFRVRVANTAGAVLSGGASLTVGPTPVAPAITSQPASVSVVVPATATFVVAATGTPTPTYQWQVSVDAGATYTNVTGATSATYVTPATAVADNGKRFRVVVTNVAGVATSNAATLSTSATAGFLYASGAIPNVSTASITAFSIDGSGRLTRLARYDVSSGGAARVLAIDSSSKHLFALGFNNAHAIYVYDIDASSGALTPISGSPFALSNHAVYDAGFAINPQGSRLYMTTIALGPPAQTAISVFTIDPLSGTPTFAFDVPLPASIGGAFPFAFDPSGSLLYDAGGSAGAFVQLVDANTGALTLSPGSPYAPPDANVNGDVSVAPTPNGAFVYFMESSAVPISNYSASQDIVGYVPNATTGALTQTSATGPVLQPWQGQQQVLAIDPTGKSLYAIGGSAVYGYSIASGTGALTTIMAPLTIPTVGTPSAIASDSGGRSVFVGGAGGIASFARDATTGALSQVSGSPYTNASDPLIPTGVNAIAVTH